MKYFLRIFCFFILVSAHAAIAASDPCIPALPATFTMTCKCGEYRREPQGYWDIEIQALVLPEYCDSRHPNSIIGQSASATYTGFTKDVHGNSTSYPPVPVSVEKNFRTDFHGGFESTNIHSGTCISSGKYANGREFHYDAQFAEGEFVSQKPGSCAITILETTRDALGWLQHFTATLGAPCNKTGLGFSSADANSLALFRSLEGFQLYLTQPNSIEFSDLTNSLPNATYYRKGFQPQ